MSSENEAGNAGAAETAQEPIDNEPGGAPVEELTPAAAGITRKPESKPDGKAKAKAKDEVKAQVKDEVKAELTPETKEELKEEVKPGTTPSSMPTRGPKSLAELMKVDLRRRRRHRS